MGVIQKFRYSPYSGKSAIGFSDEESSRKGHVVWPNVGKSRAQVQWVPSHLAVQSAAHGLFLIQLSEIPSLPDDLTVSPIRHARVDEPGKGSRPSNTTLAVGICPLTEQHCHKPPVILRGISRGIK